MRGQEEAETTPTSVMLRKTGRGSDKYTAPRIQDWDVFLQNMYAYYNSQGFWVIVSSQVVNLMYGEVPCRNNWFFMFCFHW